MGFLLENTFSGQRQSASWVCRLGGRVSGVHFPQAVLVQTPGEVQRLPRLKVSQQDGGVLPELALVTNYGQQQLQGDSGTHPHHGLVGLVVVDEQTNRGLSGAEST